MFEQILGAFVFALFGGWCFILLPMRESRRRNDARRRWGEERAPPKELRSDPAPPGWDALTAILARHLDLPSESFRPEDTLAQIDELDPGECEWLDEAGALWGVRSLRGILSKWEEPAGQITLQTLCERFAAAA